MISPRLSALQRQFDQMPAVACGLLVGSEHVALALIEVKPCSEQQKPFDSTQEMVSKKYTSFSFVHWVAGVKLDLERALPTGLRVTALVIKGGDTKHKFEDQVLFSLDSIKQGDCTLATSHALLSFESRILLTASPKQPLL